MGEALVIAGGFLGWGASLIWSAGKMSGSLTNLSERLDRFEQTFEKASDAITTTLVDHGDRISRIEGRLGG